VIEVVDPGPLTTVQDLGRVGWAAFGVPRAGAFDRAAARLANRLVGNPAEAAVLEITLGGLVLRVSDGATLACTGARCPGPDWGAAFTARPGSVVRFGVPPRGLRSYLAVRGGWDVAAELGSRSTDLLSGIGPRPLRRGDRLPVGAAPQAPPSGALAPPSSAADNVLAALPGPRVDWFAPDALVKLAATVWTVRDASDRIGVRLDGPPLVRARTTELASEPTLPGAVQVPADGRPIVFGPDAPVTGGYPVLAVLTDSAFDLAAQLRPGDAVRFALSRGSG
jgi:biotin-dependent carboxylase-like uncharacterized protein